MNEITTLPQLAEQITEHHNNAARSMRTALDEARLAGQKLLYAKEQLPHGQWLKWLKENTPVSVRMAQIYQRIFQNWETIEAAMEGPNAKSVAHLTLRGALDLIADKTEQRSDFYTENGIPDDERVRLETLADTLKNLRRRIEFIERGDDEFIAGPIPEPGNYMTVVHKPSGLHFFIDPSDDDKYWYITVYDFRGDKGDDDFGNRCFQKRPVHSDFVWLCISTVLETDFNQPPFEEGDVVLIHQEQGVRGSGYHWHTSDDDLWWAKDVTKVRRRHPREPAESPS